MEKIPPDILITTLKRIPLPLGDVLKAIKTTDASFFGFGEAYFSYIHYQAVKAWKLHKQYTANFIVPFGKVRVILYKEDSNGTPVRGYPKKIILSEDGEQYQLLTIPPSIWYGFEGLAKPTSLIFSFLNGEHSQAEQQSRSVEEFPYPWNNSDHD